ncbi:hypothetical protein NUW58_g8715 [Xylaria curta]|uniref:Uncharacterized protein n=1 Tax=Xylaria curta TaxID=42375 RepID=A0ACC1N711_9PEZI|nr:hypothetical protein NUW58_g8715 [Xylaria curta]
MFASVGDTLFTLPESFTEPQFKVDSNGIYHVRTNATVAMSPMSSNNSVNSLMGFSVHQPALGAPLQFFPAMGSKQLDEMIDAYVPGSASILEKRAAVSMEFFEYTLATGDLFKFFMVYPTPGSNHTSPTVDSGYHSGFTTSPVMSQSQWAESSSQMASPSSSRKATSTNDFSNLPGMKIMTKDGRDVTNSASRGCKTKEQRDHAHLMRIIKACDSCRRKKTKCDPSHKRPTPGTPSGKVTKKTSKTPRPAAAPPQIVAKPASNTPEFDQILSGSSSSLDSTFAESLSNPTDCFSMEWDQFIQYDEEPTEAIPYDYNFFLDPASYFSPAMTTSFSSSSTSPSQLPITPLDRDVHIISDTMVSHDHEPILPYLHPEEVEAGNNYVDFNLYSPQSSFSDEELGLAKEVAASPIQSQRLEHHGYHSHRRIEEAAGNVAASHSHHLLDHGTGLYRQDVIYDAAGGLLHDTSNYMHHWSESIGVDETGTQGGLLSLRSASQRANSQPARSRAAVNGIPTGLTIVDTVHEDATSEGLYGRETIHTQPLFNSLAVVCSLDLGSAGLSQASSQNHVDRSCGQDEPNSAKHSVVHSVDRLNQACRSPSDRLNEVGDALQKGHHIQPRTTKPQLATETTASQSMGTPGVALENVHNTQSTAVARMTMSWVPVADSPSPTPSPSLSAATATSSVANTPSRAPYELPMITSSAYDAAKLSTANLGPSFSMLRDSSSVSRHAAMAKQSLTATGTQSVSPNMLQTTSTVANLGVLSVIISLATLRPTIARSNGLIKDMCSVVSGSGARYLAIFLFFLAVYAPSPLAFVLSIVALSAVGGYNQLQQHTSFDPETRPPTSFSSHSLHLAKSIVSLLDESRASSYVKALNALHMVRCDLARKHKSWTHQSPSIARSFHRDSPRRVDSLAAMPLV